MKNLLKITTLDKYVLKQIFEIFVLGVVVFTSIIFASDTFISLIKQISMYGMPPEEYDPEDATSTSPGQI